MVTFKYFKLIQDCSWGTYAVGATFMTKPQCYPATLEKLGSKDAYLIDNGEYIYLYLGNQVSDTFIYNVRSEKRAY